MMSRSLAVALSSIALVGSAGLLIAGPMTPSVGPVGPTYKTLGEIEPRIAISQTNTPGDANHVFVINQAGSYYLTGNVAVGDGKSGIRINASHVTIDLNGHTIYGLPGSLAGITTGSTPQVCITVRNGIVRTLSEGIDISNTSQSWSQAAKFENILAQDNGGHGIRASDGTAINCVAERNGQSGIYFTNSFASSVTNCTATDNGSFGINAQRGTISNSRADRNTYSGIVMTNGLVTGCTATTNGTGYFISMGTIERSVAHNNTGVGITISGVARENQVWSTGIVAGSVGISLMGSNMTCRVEDNDIQNQATGISGIAGSGVIVRNVLRGNTIAINATVCRVGTLVNAQITSPNGNTGGGLGTTDPYANFVY